MKSIIPRGKRLILVVQHQTLRLFLLRQVPHHAEKKHIIYIIHTYLCIWYAYVNIVYKPYNRKCLYIYLTMCNSIIHTQTGVSPSEKDWSTRKLFPSKGEYTTYLKPLPSICPNKEVTYIPQLSGFVTSNLKHDIFWRASMLNYLSRLGLWESCEIRYNQSTSIYLSIYLSIRPSFCLFTHMHAYICTCTSYIAKSQTGLRLRYGSTEHIFFEQRWTKKLSHVRGSQWYLWYSVEKMKT